jgi:hypothetical protein
MKRYTHIVSGARVQVRDDKVMDSSWKLRDESESGDGAEGYDAMTVPKLKAEIDRRNTDRAEADRIPSDGKKADLVAALQLDDDASTDQ